MPLRGSLAFLLASGLMAQGPAAPAPVAKAVAATPDLEEALIRAGQALVAQHGQGQRARILRGLRQVGVAWRKEDGDGMALEAFLKQHFAGSTEALDALFGRLSFVLERVEGRMVAMERDLRWHADLEVGPLLAVDGILAGYTPGAHLGEDFFANRLAFVVLLNFPVVTPEARLAESEGWTRRQWAESRLVDRFTRRVPSAVNLALGEAQAASDGYIAGYNLWMHHVLDAKGQRLFPAGKRLLAHWNLRDEIKAQYAQGEAGLARQRVLQRLLEAIVTQDVPAQALDNPLVDWSPFDPALLAPSPVQDSDRVPPENATVHNTPEPDTRYAHILAHARALRALDAHSPLAPTAIDRKFLEERQIPEARVKAMLEAVVASPLVGEVARVMEARLGRKLEAFDLWFSGFRPGSNLDEAALDAKVRARYPDAASFQKALPALLTGLGFAEDRAAWLAAHIAVDPARGSGHAMGAQLRGDQARLRTRVGAGGMDYKGFNIAVHELGHNVEQTFSLEAVDEWLLNGVPNNAFTEAMAFTFQARDLQVLGLPGPDARAKAEGVLNEFWSVVEISAVALLDMEMWRWIYAHPEATPKQLKEAVLEIAGRLWKAHLAPVLGPKGAPLLACYSHMVNAPLYLPDYPLGHLIAFQIAQHLETTPAFGAEVERMCRLGRIAPDAWMRQATGRPVGPEALLNATAQALKAVK